jgi:two-component system, OmpR family, phosphate regulon response regulator PhoB
MLEAVRRDRQGKGRVLVVDDEADLRRLLSYNFEQAGFDVHTAETGKDALTEVTGFLPDIVILDLMLADLSGLEVCRRIRATVEGPQPIVIMLTAKGEEIDRVVGFEVGADDYVVKPFSVRELLLRIEARLKTRAEREREPTAPRAEPAIPEPPADRPIYRLGPLEVDPGGYHVFVAGQEVHVSPLEMRLLVYLFESKGYVRSRRDLLTQVWGYQPEVTSRTVDTHVKRLRDKLGAAGPLIQTVRGLGYRLADPEPGPPARALR